MMYKKFGQREGTPRTLRNVPIPTCKGEIKRARVGGGCIAMSRGVEVKSASLSRE
jgi:hypothetical protein